MSLGVSFSDLRVDNLLSVRKSSTFAGFMIGLDEEIAATTFFFFFFFAASNSSFGYSLIPYYFFFPEKVSTHKYCVL